MLWPYLVKDINLRRVRKQTLQLNEIVRLHLFKVTGYYGKMGTGWVRLESAVKQEEGIT